MQKYPFIFSDQWNWRLQRHLAFWGFWGVFQGFLYSFVVPPHICTYPVRLSVAMAESFIFLLGHMFLAYSLMYFVIPKLLLKQRYWLTAFCTIALFGMTAVLSTVLARTAIEWVRIAAYGAPYKAISRAMAGNYNMSLMAGLRGGLTIGGIAAAIKLMKHWYTKEQRNLQLEKENVESQLQLLKAQVHPHFLFNTLNNIYSYTQNTSPVAARMVSGLSDLLRFMLYEGDQPLVPLSRELAMIKDYISLEQIRYGNKLDIHIQVPENTGDLHIAPLLLLPLVENCFKHGTSNVLEQPWISFQVTVNKSEMRMKLINGKAATTTVTKSACGIGIVNVRKRLDLLYPQKHELNITDDADVFIVNLRVELERRSVSDRVLNMEQRPKVYV